MVNDPSRPRRLTLPASRRKACFAFILSLPCCLVGWWYAVARDPWLGWCGVAFFGMGGVVSLLLLIFPGFWALELAEDGFRMRSLFGTTFIRWQDVS